MKRLIAFMVALIFTFILAGCNQVAGPDRPISAYIGDNVTTRRIRYGKKISRKICRKHIKAYV